MSETISDIFIIGGGVNGCGIARDAAGRGLSVTLVEQGDLASWYLLSLDEAFSWWAEISRIF
jgi:glycine/D-amino acid oxidase-like deaminating enzyme